MATALNPIQMQLLHIFKYQRDEKELEEMRDILLDYLDKKIQKEAGQVWEERGYSNELMDEWLNTHIRTPYK
ncbi:hypothetical protein FACS189441_0120 [Betaproteobacteria bacterium]|nr:hypothetical protein FACS189441_0120 [Betaproteobacteria bacterium]GHU59150.1 hypothetical protein FACS189411_15650 [Bacteroidia bacterium]